MAKVFIGMPTHDGRAEIGASCAIFNQACKPAENAHEVIACSHSASLINYNMNALYCMALNARESHGIEWFAMVHSDITPTQYWLDALLAEAEHYGADLITGVAPIKDARGVTSTGIGHPDHSWTPWTRLTLSQLHHPDFPDTFDIGMCVEALSKLPENLRLDAPKTHLLVNTGVMAIKVTEPWSDKLVFTTNDRIFKTEDGKYIAKTESEDWRFGKLAASLGAKVFATTAVGIKHHGIAQYNNFDTWGEEKDKDVLGEHKNVTLYMSSP